MVDRSVIEQSDQSQALAACLRGDPDAEALLEQALNKTPDWVAGQKSLVRLRVEAGADEPFALLEETLQQFPDHPQLWLVYLTLLGAAERHRDAARLSRELQQRIGPVPGLRLIEARNAGLVGEAERAKALLDDLPHDLPELHYENARNALRLRDFGAANAALSFGLKADPKDIRLWALAELCWRASSDERHRWLVCGDALHCQLKLPISEDRLLEICDVLRDCHSARAAPLGQSVKGGTQTRGDLREVPNPEITELFDVIDACIETFRLWLPEFDPSHPLAPLQTRPAKITASWSIRLLEGGNHVPHIHDNGLLSSAAHLVVPKEMAKGEGQLELGRPPKDIDLGLEPLATYKPEPGHLVLFPSLLYHGTTPLQSGERLTVAFDVA